MSVTVFPEKRLNSLWQRQPSNSRIAAPVANDCSGQFLQCEALIPLDGMKQHGLEEHATQRLFVMLQKATDTSGRINSRIVTIETEFVVGLFDSGM